MLWASKFSPEVKPISQPASRRKATSRKHFPGMLRPPVKTSRHLDMKITCFGQVSFPPEGFVWRFCLSSPKQPFPHSCSSSSNHWPRLKRLKPLKALTTLTWLASSCSQQPPRGHTSMASYGPLKHSLGMLHPAANRHPKATHQWLLMGRLNNPLACFILQPTGTPRPHINRFLWASKPAVCQPFNPPNPPNP